jgi:hypothetical protein
MPDVDTSREAVERAAEWCSSNAKLFTIDLAGEDDEGRACKLRLRQQAHLNAAATLRALLDERDAQERMLSAIWNADAKAIKAWQDANPGNDLVWPDRKKRVAWLLDERDRLREALRIVISRTYSHIDGRDLLGELHPRKTLDIKRRVDGVETWFEGDWLTSLMDARDIARAALGENNE